LLSGLALAGANSLLDKGDAEGVLVMGGEDDGILTALEVGALDLSGVEVVVLSACQTGLGEEAGGEGVLGLQRAFHVAGARTTVTSLWEVPNTATQELMARFYQELWKSSADKQLSKLEALRQAQLWMLRHGASDDAQSRGLTPAWKPAAKSDRPPPYYWAAFVLSGDWR
jgi:CHAT domain-containing protein